MPNESYVRADYTCPLCIGPKDTGLVLCWPCHRSEKRANGGGYSAFAERRIAATDKLLRETKDLRARHTAKVVEAIVALIDHKVTP